MSKFKSRKFLLALITILVGIAGLFKEESGAVGTVCSIVCIAGVAITYILTEGANDRKGITNKVAEAVKEAADILVTDKNHTDCYYNFIITATISNSYRCYSILLCKTLYLFLNSIHQSSYNNFYFVRFSTVA